MFDTTRFDKIAGCLIGGAAGDALGYPVEFMFRDDILKAYGEGGIREYSLSAGGVAEISDDTQMTLFTASALLSHFADKRFESESEYIYEAYRKWYLLQSGVNVDSRGCPIAALEQMRSWRSPGNTCMSALRAELAGTVEWHINDSKGCGGVMRVAPIAFFYNDITKAMRVAAGAAALTHGHPMGYLSAAMLAGIVFFAACDDVNLYDAVERTKTELAKAFSTEKMCADISAVVDSAVEYSRNDKDDAANIAALGQGWVGDEALAIAVYSALRHSDFSNAIAAAVNHDGDSDSTGSITGSIIGAKIGLKAIPEMWLNNLELEDEILDIARDIADLPDTSKLTRYMSAR